MCFVKKKKRPTGEKCTWKSSLKTKRKKAHKDYLIEDPSTRHEVRSRWEAEDIYDEDDFCDK